VSESIRALDVEVAAAMKGLGHRKVLTVRPVWGAFCRRYELEQVAPTQSSSEERLTDEDYRALVQAAKETGSRSVFVDVGTPAPVRQQIAERTKLKVLTLDPLGSSAPEGRNTYEKILRYNAEQLTRGLGGGPAKKGGQ
jgi:ABC-type Zn uptake system ZnuABC Zn-binding protein ZnuA